MEGSSVNVVNALRKKFRIKNQTGREFLAEFLGTLLLITFGNGSVAQKVLTGGVINDFFSIVWGYGLGVAMGVYVSGAISGGHINPAVTLAMAIWGKLPWPKVPIYVFGQYLGAFVGSGIIFGVYRDALTNFESTPSITTASIWATYPGSMVSANGTTINNFLTSTNGFSDQMVGTMLLLVCVCAIVDQKNAKTPPYIAPLLISFIVVLIGISFGFNCGYAINPARDLGPRIFTLLAGWGDLPFTVTTADDVVWWWIPVVAPHVGAVLGMLLYTLCIEMHHDVSSNDLPQLKSGYQEHVQNNAKCDCGIPMLPTKIENEETTSAFISG